MTWIPVSWSVLMAWKFQLASVLSVKVGRSRSQAEMFDKGRSWFDLVSDVLCRETDFERLAA